MPKWTVINQNDGNDVFEVDGDTYEEAACEALNQLGWALAAPGKGEDEDGEKDT